MNIAHLLPASAQFPLRKHNGRYEWVLRLARLQAQSGHIVTIYCGGGTESTAGLVLKTINHPSSTKQADNVELFKLAFNDKSHDIFHSHFDALHFEMADLTTRPVIATQHWFPSSAVADKAVLNKINTVLSVPVTKYMSRADDDLGIPHTPVIYHGIDLELFQPNTDDISDRFLFVGRIAPHKGVREVVAFAAASGINLDIVGKINTSDEDYWRSFSHMVDGSAIQYLGAKAQDEVASLMRQAPGMLFFPQNLEAFGQTIIEAQACGTPVILNDLGAARELMLDQKTGYIVRDADEFKLAVAKISSIDRRACRTFAEKFDIQKMLSEYNALYSRQIGSGH